MSRVSLTAIAATAETAQFDAVAAEYESALDQGLRLAGEGPEYFAERRIEWTRRLLQDQQVDSVLDFGCGVGLATSLLQRSFTAATAWGFDPSSRAIERARAEVQRRAMQFTHDAAALPNQQFDLVYCNGVFHHIPPQERPAALSTIAAALRPGGWFALWENNPWNPGTRLVMRRIPFDRDAETLSPPEARRMVRQAGFRVQRTDAWFLFPKSLRWLRPLEYLVHRLPLGGQYLVLAQRVND